MTRRQQLIAFLYQVLGDEEEISLSLLSGDASFRRYYRFSVQGASYLAVDAPPEHENNAAFIYVANFLALNGIRVPNIFNFSLEHGFMLIEDFGDYLLGEIQKQPFLLMMEKALDALITLQQIPEDSVLELPYFDTAFMTMECERFDAWLLKSYCGIELTATESATLNQLLSDIIKQVAEQPKVVIHRDYHSRNLLYLPSQEIAVIDFQDAMLGPVTYDLVSLLRDAYVSLNPEQEQHLLNYYYHRHQGDGKRSSWDVFYHHYNMSSLQRHIKVAGIFARLAMRDGKLNYLEDLPRVLGYIQAVIKHYPQYQLIGVLAERVMQHMQEASRHS